MNIFIRTFKTYIILITYTQYPIKDFCLFLLNILHFKATNFTKNIPGQNNFIVLKFNLHLEADYEQKFVPGNVDVRP